MVVTTLALLPAAPAKSLHHCTSYSVPVHYFMRPLHHAESSRLQSQAFLACTPGPDMIRWFQDWLRASLGPDELYLSQ